MELIKEAELTGNRKLFVHSERTGLSAFFTEVEGNESLTVGKLKEVKNKKGELATRIDQPSYHIDTDSALHKMCKAAAKKLFTAGSPESYDCEYSKEYEALTQNKTENK
jgi:hypothetical protein